MKTRRIAVILIACLGMLPCMQSAVAGEAHLSVPRYNGYVGSPLQVQLIISDALDDEIPEFPEVPGLLIQRQPTPAERTSEFSINGVTTRSHELTWTYLITAARPGTYTIPSFQIKVDGTSFKTEPIELTYASSNMNELLRVAVEGNPDRIYLGESTELTLKIWIKPYQDARYQANLSARDMWNLVNPESQWGPFKAAINQVHAQRQPPPGRLVSLPGDTEDDARLAYLYEFTIDEWPDRVGPIDASDVRIEMQYPISLTRRRGIFNSGLAIESSRPATASPPRIDVEVEPLPTEGQPDWFSGAVGRFVYDVSASPTDVAVGDPITLTMIVRDQGRRPANLELLQAPKLERMPELEKGFRVPREQLGGTIQGRSKVFTQTIRATSDTISEIPALPFAYFDPASKSYETSWSRPIALQVSPASTISTSNVITPGGAVRTTPDELKNVSGGILANYTGPGLLENQSIEPSWGLLVLLLFPPLAFVGIALSSQHRVRLQANTGYVRSRSASRTAWSAMDAAATHGEIASALTGYVADRLDLPAAGLTRADIRSRLEHVGADAAMIDSIDRVLSTCEHQQYTGGQGDSDQALQADARACLKELEGARLR